MVTLWLQIQRYYQTECRQHILDTSTSSDNSGVFSLASASPGLSPSPLETPVAQPCLEETPGTPVPEHQISGPGNVAPEQVVCLTTSPEDALGILAIEQVECGSVTTAPEHRVAGSEVTPGTQEVACQTQDPHTTATEVPCGNPPTPPHCRLHVRW